MRGKLVSLKRKKTSSVGKSYADTEFSSEKEIYKRETKTYIHKNLHINGESSIISNSQTVETNEMPIIDE